MRDPPVSIDKANRLRERLLLFATWRLEPGCLG
jgi:hypothetical protein